METINLMALRHSAFYSPYLMTMAGGFLKEAGLEARYSVQTPDNLVKDRLLDGSCHVSQSAVAAGFADLEAGQPNTIRHFAQINSRDGFFLATRQSDSPFDWKQLEGRKVLVDHFFQPLAMFRYALLKKDVDWDRIEVIDAGSVDEIDAAFRAGTGDFVHQQGPAPQQMEADGIATVVASVGEAIGPVAFSSLCATQEWLQTDMATAFFSAYQQSLNACQNSPAQEIAHQLQHYGFLKEIQPAVLQDTIARYQSMGCWNHDGHISEDEYNTLLDVFEHSHLITQRHAFEQLVTSL